MELDGAAATTGDLRDTAGLDGPIIVPFVDLRPQTAAVMQVAAEAIDRTAEGGAFVLGDDVSAFEAELAAAWGVEHCVGLGNGTDAVEVALRAAGIGPGDEVIVPAFTFAGSAVGIVRCGARPVFVDVDDDTLLVDTDTVEAAIGPATAAVVAVHLYGQTARMAPLGDVCRRRGIALIEDAAQSHGAPVLGHSLAAATSFYPTKNLGAWGDGGALLTNDHEVADAARAIRNYGSADKYDHRRFGFNSRLDTLQAAVLRAKLPHLGEWNAQRLAAAEHYAELLGEAPAVRLPGTRAGGSHVWHLYVVRVPDRGACLEGMARAGVQCGIHYPAPLHHLPMFADHGASPSAGRLVVAERAAAQVLSLPLFPGIALWQQERVAEALLSCLVRAA